VTADPKTATTPGSRRLVRSRRRRTRGSCWWCERQHLGWPAAAGQLL